MITREELKELAQGMLEAHGQTEIDDCRCKRCNIAREVLKPQPFKCFVDCGPGEEPTYPECSIDLGRPEECGLADMGKTKETCGYWMEY